MVVADSRRFVPEVNHLLTLARDLAPDEKGHAERLAELAEAVHQVCTSIYQEEREAS
jgi:hypothetical protein